MENNKENINTFKPDSVAINVGVNNPLTSVGFGYDILQKDFSWYVERGRFSMEIDNLQSRFKTLDDVDLCYTIGLPKSFKKLNDIFINETTFMNKILKYAPLGVSITGCTNRTETNMCVNVDFRIKYLLEIGLSPCKTFDNQDMKEFLNEYKFLKNLLVNSDGTIYDIIDKNTSQKSSKIITHTIQKKDNLLDYKAAHHDDSLKREVKSVHKKRVDLDEGKKQKSEKNNNKNDNHFQANQAYQYFNFQIDSNSNPFFTEHAIIANLYNTSNGELIASETRKIFELSSQSKNAIYAAQNYLASALLNNAFSSSDNRISVDEVSKNLLKIGAETFARSYIEKHLLDNLNSPLSKSVAGGLVDVGFATIHGNAENAVRVGFTSTANRLMEQLTQLPLSFSTSRFISTNDLFRSNLISIDSSRQNFNMAFGKGALVGIHFEKAFTNYKNSDGNLLDTFL